jgi:hypothetical protein
MKVIELRTALEQLANILTSAGAKSQDKEVRSFLKLFDGQEDMLVSDFFEDLRERLKANTGNGKLAHANLASVEQYVRRLEAAGIDKNIFDAVYSDIASDRSIVKEDADLIAHRYTLGREKWPTKAEALREIKLAFQERAYRAAKSVQVEKASRW